MTELLAFLVLALSVSSGPDPTATQCAEVLSQLSQSIARVTHVRQVSFAAARTTVALARVRGPELVYTIQGPGDEVAIVLCALGGEATEK